MTQSSLEDAIVAGQEIAQLVPEDAVIVAAEPFYFGMLNHRNFVGGAIEGMLVTWDGFSPAAAWDLVAPGAVVLSEDWPEPPKTAALLAYLGAHDFTLRQCWQTPSYGRVELWMTGSTAPGLSDTAPCIPVCVPRLGCD